MGAPRRAIKWRGAALRTPNALARSLEYSGTLIAACTPRDSQGARGVHIVLRLLGLGGSPAAPNLKPARSRLSQAVTLTTRKAAAADSFGRRRRRWAAADRFWALATCHFLQTRHHRRRGRPAQGGHVRPLAGRLLLRPAPAPVNLRAPACAPPAPGGHFRWPERADRLCDRREFEFAFGWTLR